ncbi:MAG: UDP-N-acetylmuramate dehydrogenase [bacterium]|nr:UDP-N-acetylmuramate dehydrogenase [bacterium]
MEIKKNIDLKPYTYFKIGGHAKYFTDVTNPGELRDAVKFAKGEGVPFFIAGATSNTLISDDGYPGVFIRMMMRNIVTDGDTLRVDAGVPNAIAVSYALKQGLGGFEWAIGIPGTIGGSVRGNAGCFSGEMRDVVKKVTLFNTLTDDTEVLDNQGCGFKYRHSIFKEYPHLVVLSADLGLRKTNPDVSQRFVRYYTSTRTDKQDIGASSAGCVFKNVEWPSDRKQREKLFERFPDLQDFIGRQNIPIGFLIDNALGLKGKRIGHVHISDKHANYFINDGGATAEQVIMLIGLVKERIHRKFGLHPEEEIQYVGF